MATRARQRVVDLKMVSAMVHAIEENIHWVLAGKDEVARLAITAMLAEGHILIEDVPGVGKTLLAKSLATSIDCSVSRIQFTPDLLPSDVTGVTVYTPDTGEFEFTPGPIFANIVLGDEINRAGPKTQSALLESMEERGVTIDGVTHELAIPYMVIATQNPIELEGTYPLPEAQRDRFLMRLRIGYPDVESELEILHTHGRGDPLSELEPVTDATTVAAAIETVRNVAITEPMERYLIDICRTTREHPDVELGASPRASLAMLRAARAWAATADRDYVIPDDAKRLAPHVLPHRLILRPEAELSGRTAAAVIADVLSMVPVPTE
ncbi:MAG: AAA family ATPase [Nitriliruptorales bacterium]|nr:AAA family ATPase [Nitriliruptorales bacterium]